MGDRLGTEALAWYGLELPAIHGPLPSVWSVLTIEKREVDSVQRLADGTILDGEFQSDSVGSQGSRAGFSRCRDLGDALPHRDHDGRGPSQSALGRIRPGFRGGRSALESRVVSRVRWANRLQAACGQSRASGDLGVGRLFWTSHFCR